MVIRLLSPKLTSQNTNIQSESLKDNNACVKEQLDLIIIIFNSKGVLSQRARVYFHPCFHPQILTNEVEDRMSDLMSASVSSFED